MLALTVAAVSAPPARAEPGGPLLSLVDAAAERLQVAEPVASYKWRTHGAVEDPARVRQELATLREDAAAAQIDPDYVATVFTDQIGATEAIEYSRFAEWKLDPATVPPAPPDLTTARTVIDDLNTKILSHISLNWSLLHSPACTAELAAASAESIRRRRFDDLYRRALTAATRSYCQVAAQA
ncbi:secreted chorismate mutase [Mycobacterium kiyosense]|nr:secreted chorismate mutase [Mycobacterium kiyosense]BDE14238.1 secreted chorismate mutase [Mycobacterium sp. 20KCMC460]GLB93739.1 secreted chorismate mutase [Mycobacterium kiyosense]GLD01320.1 secreted chorismate mutase [Mycobacterium kiyosense]GLD16074.1 secreted chorismate mutase [Mycobacterium kiyosense]